MMFGLEPASLKERKPLKLRLPDAALELYELTRLRGITEVAPVTRFGIGKDKKEVKPNAVSSKRVLGDPLIVVSIAKLPFEASLYHGWYSIMHQSLVFRSNDEIGISQVVRKQGSIPGPSQQNPSPDRVPIRQSGLGKGVVETAKIARQDLPAYGSVQNGKPPEPWGNGSAEQATAEVLHDRGRLSQAPMTGWCSLSVDRGLQIFSRLREPG
jgi:hypothetical protein